MRNCSELQMEEICSSTNKFFAKWKRKTTRNKQVLSCKQTKCQSILRKHFTNSENGCQGKYAASYDDGRYSMKPYIVFFDQSILKRIYMKKYNFIDIFNSLNKFR